MNFRQARLRGHNYRFQTMFCKICGRSKFLDITFLKDALLFFELFPGSDYNQRKLPNQKFCYTGGSSTYHKSLTLLQFWPMYAQVGDFHISMVPSSVLWDLLQTH